MDDLIKLSLAATSGCARGRGSRVAARSRKGSWRTLDLRLAAERMLSRGLSGEAKTSDATDHESGIR
jgi:hypothetical protein